MSSRSIAINIRVIGDGSGADQVTGALKRTQVETDRLTQLQAGLTNSFIVGNLAARAISISFYAIKDALMSAASAGIDFEFSMAKFRAITGSSIELTNDLSNSVRQLALSTGQSQEELAKTSLEMAKMGLSASQVESILPNVAKLARGLDEDLVATGKAVVFMLNAYGISAQEAEKITNELGYSVKISALDIHSFSTAFQYVGATARLAGVSIETLQASMDVLSNAGIRASTIGTQLRRVITDLGNENSKAAKIIGGTIESYGSLEKALDAVAAKHLDAGGMAAIFGRNASSTADILVRYRNVISEVAEDTSKATTASGTMNDIIQNTLKGSIDRLTTSWKDLGIEILSSNGALKDFIDLLGKAISHITKFEFDKHRVQDFQAKDPEGYKKSFDELYPKTGNDNSDKMLANLDMVTGFGMSNQDILGTNAYLSFKAKQDVKTFVDKTKDDIQQAILESLDASQAKDYAGKTIPSDLYFKPKNQGKFDYLASLYTDGEDQINFLKAWHDASVKLVQKVEEGEDKNPLPDIKGNKKAAKSLNMYLASTEGTFPLGESGYDSSTFPNPFGKYPNPVGKKSPFLGAGSGEPKTDLDLNALSGLSKKQLEELHKDFAPLRKDIEAYNKLMGEAAIETHAAKLAFDLFSVSSKQLTDKLGTQMIESIARGKNAFKDFDDFFGEFTKNLLAQIASLILQFIILRTVMAAIGVVSTGGFGFAGVAAGSFTSGILSGLGGTNTGLKPQATGGSFVTTGPQSLLVGESGRERVNIMPASKVATNASSGSTGLTVVIQGDVHDYKAFQRKVKSAIARNKKDFI